MNKAKQLLGLLEENPPRRIIIKPSNAGKKMHVSEVTGMIHKWIMDRRYGLEDKWADDLAVMYLTGDMTLMHSKPISYIENRYHLKPESAKKLWHDLEQEFGHYRKFLQDHDGVEEIIVKGKDIQAVDEPTEDKVIKTTKINGFKVVITKDYKGELFATAYDKDGEYQASASDDDMETVIELITNELTFDDDETDEAKSKGKSSSKRYTAVVHWSNGDSEEIDVDASSEADAKAKVHAELEKNYEPGGVIKKIIGPRTGYYV